MQSPTFDQLQATHKALKYPFFTAGNFNLNIIGIRSADNRSNLFNDVICLAYLDDGLKKVMCYHATTDPGAYWLTHPMNYDGTAILIPGHYPKMFSIGKHRGQYEALVQTGHCLVWRDKNQDSVLDMNGRCYDASNCGINLHEAGVQSTLVGKWSAGCQVLARRQDFSHLMGIVRRSAESYGETFSYTLLTEDQLIG